VTLRFMQFGRRFQYSRHVGFHIITAIVIEGGVEVLFRTLEVPQLRVSLTKSLCYECNGILIADRLGIRQGAFHVVDRLGAPTEELGYSETGVHLVRHLFPTL
jgi:hypothetical protein